MPGEKSRENGKKGGRPKGAKALEALAYRELLLKRIEEEREPIIQALIDKAKSGDIKAIQEINERHLGKVIAPVDVTSKGEQLGYIALPPLKDD